MGVVKKSIPFNFNKTKIDDKSVLFTINIDRLDENLINYIDEVIVELCKGKRKVDISVLKKSLLQYLTDKKDSNLFCGAISEFFVHLFLKAKGFKQAFLYLNLEENSIKKGFDGFYTKNNESWIVESKSGEITTLNISHIKKIKEAYTGVSNKISGRDNVNNPWNNAYNHAFLVSSNKKLLEKINDLSNKYAAKIYDNPNNFNLIPCSTIILENEWKEIDIPHIMSKLKNFIPTIKYNKLVIVSINKKSLNHFINYLKM